MSAPVAFADDDLICPTCGGDHVATEDDGTASCDTCGAAGLVWVDVSNVFGEGYRADLGPLTLAVERVIGGSNADRDPFGWSVYDDNGELANDMAATVADGQRDATKFAREALARRR